MTIVVALTGYAGVGKDTVGSMLVEHHGFVRVAFADVLKEFVEEIGEYLTVFTDVCPPQACVEEIVSYYGTLDEAKRNQPAVRNLLMAIGGAGDPPTGARKVFGKDFWIRTAFKRAKKSDRYVVTDLSFVDEAEWLVRRFDTYFWNIVRPGCSGKRVNGTDFLSEVGSYDEIVNDGTKHELLQKVDDSVYALDANTSVILP